MRTTTAAATLLLAIGTLAGCTTTHATSSKPATPAPTITPATETPDDEASSEAPQDETLPLAGVASYENNVGLRLGSFARGKSHDYASPENMPYLKFTVHVTNGSGKTMDLSELSVSCAFGKDLQSGEQVFDDGLEGAPDVHLRSGRSATVTTACELPKDAHYIQIEVAPSYETETTVFAGDVK